MYISATLQSSEAPARLSFNSSILLIPTAAKHRQNSACPILSEAFRFRNSVKICRFPSPKSRVAKFDRLRMRDLSALVSSLVPRGGGKCPKIGCGYLLFDCFFSLLTPDIRRWRDMLGADRDNSAANRANPIAPVSN